ncbi:hypothetical protein X948_5566 [Burkholderia pseudomallei MSHR5608]|nr:hypothetical protein X948_5566 [Burkholderia pseudomallei MSHR5608]
MSRQSVFSRLRKVRTYGSGKFRPSYQVYSVSH